MALIAHVGRCDGIGRHFRREDGPVVRSSGGAAGVGVARRASPQVRAPPALQVPPAESDPDLRRPSLRARARARSRIAATYHHLRATAVAVFLLAQVRGSEKRAVGIPTALKCTDAAVFFDAPRVVGTTGVVVAQFRAKPIGPVRARAETLDVALIRTSCTPAPTLRETSELWHAQMQIKTSASRIGPEPTARRSPAPLQGSDRQRSERQLSDEAADVPHEVRPLAFRGLLHRADHAILRVVLERHRRRVAVRGARAGELPVRRVDVAIA